MLPFFTKRSVVFVISATYLATLHFTTFQTLWPRLSPLLLNPKTHHSVAVVKTPRLEPVLSQLHGFCIRTSICSIPTVLVFMPAFYVRSMGCFVKFPIQMECKGADSGVDEHSSLTGRVVVWTDVQLTGNTLCWSVLLVVAFREVPW